MGKAMRFPLCRQTATVYHFDAETGEVTRTVLDGVLFDRRLRAVQGTAGETAAQAFLLVVPEAAARYGTDYTLAPGDRVFEGEGPLVDAAGWPGFVPAEADGLAVVQYVDPKTRRGEPSHLEAGGWWTKSGTGAHSLT